MTKAKRTDSRTWISLALAALVTAAFLPDARGAAFELPDHGSVALGRAGAFTAKADDLTAIYYNPGGLGRIKGTKFLFNSNLINCNATFQRTGLDPNIYSNDYQRPFSPVSNEAGIFFNPFIAVSSDFGLKDFTFVVGGYGPHSYGNHRYPLNGAQRYSLVENDIMILFYTVAVAWQPSKRFGVGLSLQWAHMPKFNVSMMISGSPAGEPENSTLDAFNTLRVSDPFAPTAILGVWFSPMEGLQIGLSGRPPIFLDASGKLAFTPPSATPNIKLTSDNVRISLSLPAVARLGVRYVYKDIFDIELDIIGEFWSVIERVKVTTNTAIDTGMGMVPLDQIVQVKNMNDTISFRLGGDWNILKGKVPLTLRVGYLFETGAYPPETTNLEYLSSTRHGLTFGVSVRYKAVEVSLAYAHIFQSTVTAAGGLVRMVTPLLDPTDPNKDKVVGDGVYSSGYDVFSLGLIIHFDSFYGQSKKK